MAHTFDNKVKIPVTVNTSTSATTATGTFACGANATLLTLGLIYAGGSNRTGGAPTYGSITGTQADTARRAATSPEASTELWYWLDPTRSTTLLISIPNAGGLALEGFVSSFNAQSGYTSILDVAAGTGSSSTNPTVRLVTTADGDAIIGVVASGLNAWGPTTQSGTVIYNEDPAAWGGGAQYILQPTAGTILSAWTAGSDDWGSVAAAFKELFSSAETKTVTDTAIGNEGGSLSAQMTTPDSNMPARIQVEYELPVTYLDEVTDGVNYHFTWRGDEIEAMTPNTDWLPFYPEG